MMNIHLRVESRIGAPHAVVTVFVNGVNCGRLTLLTEEFAVFEDIIEQGCVVRDCGDTLKVTGTRPTAGDVS